MTDTGPFFFQSVFHFAALCMAVYIAQRLLARVRHRRRDTSAFHAASFEARMTQVRPPTSDITDPDAVEALVVLGYPRREAISAVTSHGRSASTTEERVLAVLTSAARDSN